MRKSEMKVNRKTSTLGEKISRIWMTAIITAYTVFLSSKSVYAADFGSSIFATGTKNLVTDIGKWLLILAPISGSVVGVYFFIRRQAADDMDQKKWNDRIKVTVISTIGAVLVSALIVLIASYYGKTVTTGI